MEEFPYAYLYNLKPRGKPLTEFWSGLFEGEGSFFVSQKVYKKKHLLYFKAQLRMTSVDIITEFLEWAGDGSFHETDVAEYYGHSNYKMQYLWVGGEVASLQIATDMWPYLHLDRRSQIATAMNRILEFRAFNDLSQTVRSVKRSRG